MKRIPKPNEIYQHFKGNLYKVITLAKHSETGEMMVLYQALYGDFDIYVRPLDSFISEVDHEKYPEIAAKYRFTEIPAVMGIKDVPANSSPDETNQEETGEPEKTGQRTEHSVSDYEQDAGNLSSEYAREVSVSDAEKPAGDADEDYPGIDPAVMAFLDAETYKEKMDILIDVHERITDDMINTMSVSLDLEVGDGDTEERYWELKNCLLTLEKYEIDRLR